MYNSKCDIKISAICLQETWLSEDSDLSLLHLDGYQLISKGKSCSAHGGVAIYLHESFTYRVISPDIISDIWDGQFIEIYIEEGQKSKSVILGNIYRPPRQSLENINTFINEYEIICHQFRQMKHVVLTGDFNIDLMKFKDNNSINSFLETLMSNGYIPKITLPTRLTNRKGTLIDNFFIKISDDFSSTTSGIIINNISDHFPYFVSLDYLNICKPKSKFINVIPSFCKSIENLIHELSSPDVSVSLQNISGRNPNESYDNLMNILKPLIDKHFEYKQIRYNKYKNKKCQWITKGILKSIAFRDKLYIKYKSTPIDSVQYNNLKVNLKSYNTILRKTIREAKTLYYQTCFSKFKSDIKKTWATINDIIRKENNKTNIPKYFLINNTKVSDNLEIANEFNTFFTKIGPTLADSIDAPTNKSYKDYLTVPVNNIFKFHEITTEDVYKAIQTLKPKTSYGIDKISNKLLKSLSDKLAIPLKNIINQSFSSGIFPNKLKISKVTPLYKNKENNLLNNYRPISILPSVSKVFERIMHNQIYKHFTSLDLFYKSQYGFRKEHSTEYATLELINRIIFQMDQNKFPLNIFMDLSKAFDTLDHQILLDKLEYYGFKDMSLNLMTSYLNSRTQYVVYNGVSSSCLDITCGVPQGSILGPLLFIIYVNDLPLVSENFDFIVYADDTTLFSTLSHPNPNIDEIDVINSELLNVHNWLKLNKLSLNINKTKAMVFHTTQRQVIYPNIYLENNKIEFVDKFNFLGLIVDKNLSFKPHIDMISNKISRATGIMNKLKKFVPTSALLHIYNCLILSHINYGLIIWGPYINRNTRLEKLQKKAIRIVNNVKYNSHTNPLFKKNSTLKLNDMCALQDFKFCYKFAHGLLPVYFLDNLILERSQHYSTRQTGQLKLPRVNHDFARKSITYRYPSVYNSMPINFKDKIFTHSLFGFKFNIKQTLISSYDSPCTILNCYICQNS